MQSNLRKLSRVMPYADNPSGSNTPANQPQKITSLLEIPVESRLVLGILRIASYQGTLPSPDTQVLDAFGRVLDPSQDRARTLNHMQTFNQCVLADTTRALDIYNRPVQTLSDDEQIIMNNLKSLARGKPNNMELDSVMNETVRHRFRTTSRYLLTKPSMDGLYTTGNIAWNTHRHNESPPPEAQLPPFHTQVLASVVECKDLSFHETLIVTIVRLWVRGIATQYDSDRAVHLFCSHLALPRLGHAMLTILQQTAKSAHRQIDVRCICCPELSPDEARILCAVSALFHNQASEYQEHLSDWLPQSEAQPAYLLSASEFFAPNDPHTILPLRNWDFALLSARQPLFEPSAPDAQQTYH